MSEDNPQTESAPAPDLPLVHWRGRSYEVAITQYAENENTCIVFLNRNTGQVEVKASVNLHVVPPWQCFIKDYSENRGVLEALIKAHLVQLMGHSVQNGSAEFELVSLAPAFAAQFGIEVPEADAPSEVAATQDIVDQAAPSNGVPSRPAPSDEDVGEAPSNWAEMEAQQNAALIEKAQQERADAEGETGEPEQDPNATA